MTRDIQAPFFFGLLLLPVLTVPTTSGHTSRDTQTSNIQSSPMPSSTDGSAIPPPATTRICKEGFLNCFCRFIKKTGFWDSFISSSVIDAPFPSSAQPGSGVPGWGIALLVLVCILVALAIIYVIALAVCQCRRKNCGQLDIFPTRDAYHPMSEYPTYHTHGRYVPPGSTKRNPYEQVSAGNGGGSLSYSNLAATSANL
uniref:Mucin 1, cell surface associated n=2 Tax=Sus scrofa TaxID=9823 RepID=A0A8D0LM55_PIG